MQTNACDWTQMGGCLGRGRSFRGDDRGAGGKLGGWWIFSLSGLRWRLLNAHTCQHWSNYLFNYVFKYVTSNMFSLSCVNHTSLKLLKIATAIDELSPGKGRVSQPGNRGKPWGVGAGDAAKKMGTGEPGRWGGKQWVSQSQHFQKEGVWLLLHTLPSSCRSGVKMWLYGDYWWPWHVRKQ